MAFMAESSTFSPAQGAVGMGSLCLAWPPFKRPRPRLRPRALWDLPMTTERVGKGLKGRAGLVDGQDLMKAAARV